MSGLEREALARRIASHVERLCAVGDRDPGAPGNLAATAYFATQAEAAGIAVERLPFQCWTWEPGGVTLETGGQSFTAFPGPYSPPLDATASLVAASSTEELDALGDARGRVLLLHGALTASQLVPKRYPFFQVDEHVAIHEALERLAPAAVVAATDRDPGLAGGVSPFPLFDDADVPFPSAYMSAEEGARLLAHVGGDVRLRIDSRRILSNGEQLVGRRAAGTDGVPRLLVCGHIDAKKGTPGALDNAAGAAVLLGVAELLAAEPAGFDLEIVPFNGEDQYAASGEMAYLAAHGDALNAISLAVNIDAAGYREGFSAYSFYGVPDELKQLAAREAERFDGGIRQGPEWPASDHMVLAMRGVPTIAVTSERFAMLGSEITHTPRDTPELVDPFKLAEVAEWIVNLGRGLG